MAWTYILECVDFSFYVGSTHNLDDRLRQHAMGKGGDYTRARLPVRLVWAGEFERVDEACAWERRIHGWSRAKKLALINGKFDDLPGLARGRGRGESTT